MRFEPPLQRGYFVRRYKRFLADIRTEDGRQLTIHCPNTGSMKNCAEPGDEVWFSESDNPKRKYAFTWELVRSRKGHYIGINTGRANELVKSGIENGRVGELSGYESLLREVSYGRENSRIDLLLSGGAGKPDCYVEVKSVTLLEAPVSRGTGYFPDAVSQRGARHLRELARRAAEGYRGVLFYCVQHSGIRLVRPAAHIDPVYAESMQQAVRAGVEVLAYKTRMSASGLSISRRLPVETGV